MRAFCCLLERLTRELRVKLAGRDLTEYNRTQLAKLLKDT